MSQLAFSAWSMGMNPAIPQSLSRITFGLVEFVPLACLSKSVEGTAETVDEQATRAAASDSMDFILKTCLAE